MQRVTRGGLIGILAAMLVTQACGSNKPGVWNGSFSEDGSASLELGEESKAKSTGEQSENVDDFLVRFSSSGQLDQFLQESRASLGDQVSTEVLEANHIALKDNSGNYRDLYVSMFDVLEASKDGACRYEHLHAELALDDLEKAPGLVMLLKSMKVSSEGKGFKLKFAKAADGEITEQDLVHIDEAPDVESSGKSAGRLVADISCKDGASQTELELRVPPKRRGSSTMDSDPIPMVHVEEATDL